MSYVYRMAFTNLIYLGKDEEGRAENVVEIMRNFLSSLRSRMHELDEDEQVRFSVWHRVPERWKEKSPLSNEILEKLHPLFSLAWFR